ncbi:RNA recognition motif and CCHC-type zinc finger domain-containing protein [Diaporthe sp. PMI_573]|nr:RNA recognition motif and CCHC-type zinc finger domain-containing protein [Diaporthaceae sp. PMI_573]
MAESAPSPTSGAAASSNLSWSTDDQALAQTFEQYGAIEKATVVMRDGRSAGFGFVDFSDDQAAKTAIDEMNNSELDGRTITVQERIQRSGGGGFGGGRGRGGFSRGGRGGFSRDGGGGGGYGGRDGGYGGREGGYGGRDGGRDGGYSRDGGNSRGDSYRGGGRGGGWGRDSGRDNGYSGGNGSREGPY